MEARIPEEVLKAPVHGVNLAPGSLRDQLADETLLVFLRHFGCIFCRETISEIRAASEGAADFPKVLFFFQGTPTEGRAFLRRYWPGAHAISDPGARFYEAFGIGRGGLWKMFRPAVWVAERRASARGHRNGPAAGDIWRMPGLFLAEGETLVWSHDFRHAGDHPDFARIPSLARSGNAQSGNARRGDVG